MEETKSAFSKQEKNKTIISIGKASGGGGIGVGIIFLGGAVASATAAFMIRRRLRKSGDNSKNCNHDRSTPSSEIPYKFLEDRNKNQSKGLQFVAPDSSPFTDKDQNLSNGTAKIGVQANHNTIICDQSFFLDQKHKVEANGGKGDPIADIEEIIHSNSPKGLGTCTQFDAYPIKEEESALPLVENETLLHPINMADHFSGEEIKTTQEDVSNDTALVEQGTEEEHQLILENIEGEEMEINCCPDEDMRELNCQEAAEKINAEQRTITILQSGEEQESLLNCGQETESTCNLSLFKDEKLESEESSLAFETIEVIEKDEVLDPADAEPDKADTLTRMTEVHGSLCTENFGLSNRNEKLEASHEDLGKGNTTILMLVEEENKCNHHDSSLNFEANEETKGNETVEAADEDEHKDIVTSEAGEKKCVGSLTAETVEILEAVEMLEEVEGRDNEVVLVEDGKGAQHDKEISCEESQSTTEKSQFSNDIAPGRHSNQQKLQIEEPKSPLNGDPKDNSVADKLTTEDSSCENCGATVPNMPLTGVNTPAMVKPEIGIGNGFTEVQLSAEGPEGRKENGVGEPATEDRVVESENSAIQSVEKQLHLKGYNEKQLEEVKDTFQVEYADDMTIEEHNLMSPEEDSVDDSNEANMAEKVEESSEGTGDSSIESSAEPIWPAGSLEEVSRELKELKINEQKEEQMEEDQTVKTQVHMYLKNIGTDGIIDNSIRKGNDHKGNSKLTFLQRVMLDLAEQAHQPTYTRKLRILIPTLLVLSWSLCFWHFGSPFLKISLIVILIKILSKIQGF